MAFFLKTVSTFIIIEALAASTFALAPVTGFTVQGGGVAISMTNVAQKGVLWEPWLSAVKTAGDNESINWLEDNMTAFFTAWKECMEHGVEASAKEKRKQYFALSVADVLGQLAVLGNRELYIKAMTWIQKARADLQSNAHNPIDVSARNWMTKKVKGNEYELRKTWEVQQGESVQEDLWKKSGDVDSELYDQIYDQIVQLALHGEDTLLQRYSLYWLVQLHAKFRALSALSKHWVKKSEGMWKGDGVAEFTEVCEQFQVAWQDEQLKKQWLGRMEPWLREIFPGLHVRNGKITLGGESVSTDELDEKVPSVSDLSQEASVIPVKNDPKPAIVALTPDRLDDLVSAIPFQTYVEDNMLSIDFVTLLRLLEIEYENNVASFTSDQKTSCVGLFAKLLGRHKILVTAKQWNLVSDVLKKDFPGLNGFAMKREMFRHNAKVDAQKQYCLVKDSFSKLMAKHFDYITALRENAKKRYNEKKTVAIYPLADADDARQALFRAELQLMQRVMLSNNLALVNEVKQWMLFLHSFTAEVVATLAVDNLNPACVFGYGAGLYLWNKLTSESSHPHLVSPKVVYLEDVYYLWAKQWREKFGAMFGNDFRSKLVGHDCLVPWKPLDKASQFPRGMESIVALESRVNRFSERSSKGGGDKAVLGYATWMKDLVLEFFALTVDVEQVINSGSADQRDKALDLQEKLQDFWRKLMVPEKSPHEAQESQEGGARSLSMLIPTGHLDNEAAALATDFQRKLLQKIFKSDHEDLSWDKITVYVGEQPAVARNQVTESGKVLYLDPLFFNLSEALQTLILKNEYFQMAIQVDISKTSYVIEVQSLLQAVQSMPQNLLKSAINNLKEHLSSLKDKGVDADLLTAFESYVDLLTSLNEKWVTIQGKSSSEDIMTWYDVDSDLSQLFEKSLGVLISA